MTNYYVDTADGDDVNSGLSSGAAWQTLGYGADMLSAGDSLTVIAPVTTPSRNGIAPLAGTAIQGTSATDRAYITGLVNVSHGATIENPIKNGNCEAWLSASEPWAITQSAGDTIARSADAHGGTYSINATKVAVSIWLYVNVRLPAATAMNFSYWHKGSVAGRWNFYIKDIADNKYLQADGSWAGAYIFDPNDFNAAWHSYSKTFTTNTAGRYEIGVGQPYVEAVYLDDISLEYTGISTYQWSDVPAQNYKILNIVFPSQPRILAKCSTANWTASGLDALTVAPLAASLAACGTTPGSWYYDAATDLVYYCPAAGEDVTDLHVEITQPPTAIDATETSGVGYLAASNVTLKNLNIHYANSYGIHATTAANMALDHVACDYAGISCYYIVNGAVLRADHCSGKHSYQEDIFNIGDAGTMFTADRCLAEYAMDDGFQILAGGMAILTRCVSQLNGLELGAGDSGFSMEGANGTMVLRNCTAYGNYGYGISHAGTGTGSCTVQNCIAYGTVSGSQYDAHTSVVHSTFTHDHNLFGGHVAAWIVDATEIDGSDPLFVSAPTDLSLQSDSPAIGAGTDVGLFYSGDAPDCGAYERWASRGATWLHLAGVHDDEP